MEDVVERFHSSSVPCVVRCDQASNRTTVCEKGQKKLRTGKRQRMPLAVPWEKWTLHGQGRKSVGIT